MRAAPPPPPAPSPAWPASAPPASRQTFLGIDRSLWIGAWVPLLPVAVFRLVAPGFLQPLFDERVRIAGLPPAALFLALPLIVLVAGRLNRTLGWVALALATSTAIFGVILGPAAVLILINLST